jgi:hypothetical protein
LPDPISKIPNTKKAGGVAQGVGPEIKPQYRKKKKKSQLSSHLFSNTTDFQVTFSSLQIHAEKDPSLKAEDL